MSAIESGVSSTSTVSRKRSFSSTTAFNSITGNSTTINSTNLSIDNETMVTTKNNQTFGKRKKLQDQSSVEYMTTTTTTRRRRRQVVTDHSSTTTTTTNVEKGSRRSSSQRSIPAFLHKLYNMVNDSLTTQFIRWSKDGNSFLVEDHEKFAELVLPRFYKHNTFASFVRQLNMYDFHKIPHIQQGVLFTIDNTESELWEFSHSNFKRDRPDLLVTIARKRNKDRNNAVDMDLSSVVKEISAIKKNQTNITNDLKNLQRDNEILWKETLAARENHSRHQEVISKILQFLTTVFSNNFPQLDHIMINDQLQQLRQQQGLQEKNKQADMSYRQGCLFSSHMINNAQNTGSDSTSTSESGNDMEDDFEKSNSDNDFMEDDMAQQLLPKTTNNAEILDVQLPFTQENFNTEYFFNELDDIKALADSAPPTFSTSLLNKENDAYNITSRSAEAITNDINKLQGNVEALVVQLGIGPEKPVEFEDLANGYNNMISSASKNDKLRLFELAATQVSPQTQTLTQFVQAGDTKAPHQPMQLPINQVHSLPVSFTSSNSSSQSDIFSHVLTSVEPYHADPDATKPTHNVYQSNTIPTTTPKINTVNSQLDPTFFKSNTFTTANNNTKPNNDLEHCSDQTDQLFRANVLIQQRLQTSKYHPLYHPHSSSSNLSSHHSLAQESSYTSQQMYQTSFNSMLNSSVPSYQTTYHPFHNSRRLQ